MSSGICKRDLLRFGTNVQSFSMTGYNFNALAGQNHRGRAAVIFTNM
jgi:hypothetical protein